MSDSHGPDDGSSPPSSGGTPYAAYSGDILGTSGDEEPTKRVLWLVVAGAGVLVLALVGGVTYGVGALSGGGSQPESALPSGAVAFLKVDLDPSAGQKVDAFRFMRKFPALRSKVQGDDLRKIAYEAVSDSAGWADDVDFDRDVAPWMGDRVAVAAYPPHDKSDGAAELDVVLALQLRDEDKAREGLKKVTMASLQGTADAGPPGFVITGDYALLAPDQEAADRAAQDVKDGTLDEDSDLARDLADAGDGVLAAWLDADAMRPLMGDLDRSTVFGAPGGFAGAATGRSTLVARFDGPDVFELVGQVRDTETASWSSHRVQGMAELPESSVVAVGLADGDELVTRAFASIRKGLGDEARMPGESTFDDSVAQAEQSLGIEIPEDIAALLGDNLVAALDGGDSGEIEVGARISTDVARAERVLDAITKASGGALPLERRTVGKDLVVASTPKQADRLSADGTLGDKEAFTKSLPDLEDADAAVWVDVKGLLGGLFGGGTGDGASPVDKDLEPLQGVGFSVGSEDKGSATFHLRVVTN